MLHIFYVFSNITARIIPFIIDHLGLDLNDVVVILDRSQSKKSIEIPVRVEEGDFHQFENRWPNFFLNWPSIRQNSDRIEALTAHNSYIAYLPSDSGFTCQQIIHHPKCEGYYLIEEGLASYIPPGGSPVIINPPNLYRKLRSNIRILIQGRGRIFLPYTSHLIWRKKYRGAFGSNANVFPGFPPKTTNLECQLFQSENRDFTKLLVIDDLSAFRKDIQISYLKAISQVIISETKENDYWAYKIHPNCRNWEWLSASIESIFSDNHQTRLQHHELQSNECVEDIGLGKGVITYGIMSSCLFYIYQGGGQVVCFKNLLLKSNPNFQKFWDIHIPETLNQRIALHPSFLE
jgi:hypothetical protein